MVLLGGGHSSSDLHRRVIGRLEGLGPECPDLQVMRQCAAEAIRAFEAEDLAALGLAMSANTDAQRRLHDDLVCRDADAVIAAARAHGAAGWKVNGAGGEGGSLAILGAESADAQRAMLVRDSKPRTPSSPSTRAPPDARHVATGSVHRQATAGAEAVFSD